MNPLFPQAQMPDNPLMPQQRGQFVNVPSAPQAPQQGGMFGGGGKFGIGQAIVAALNGYLAGTRGPGQQVGINNLQMLDEDRQRKALAQQAAIAHQQQLEDQRSQFTFEQDYKAAHDTPDIQQRIDVLNKIDPTLGATYAHNYAANGGGMGPVLTNPLTGQQMMPAGKAPAQEPPAEAVQRLKANPAEAAQFDEVFGPGASAKFLGGGGQAATPPATFP